MNVASHRNAVVALSLELARELNRRRRHLHRR